MLSLTAFRGQTNETAKIRNSAKMSRCFSHLGMFFREAAQEERLGKYFFSYLLQFCENAVFLSLVVNKLNLLRKNNIEGHSRSHFHAGITSIN